MIVILVVNIYITISFFGNCLSIARQWTKIRQKTNHFFPKSFSTFGMNAINFLDADPETRIDPMATVFPRVTKCTYRKYGPSGTIQNHDAMCVMPINIVNEKIYVFLWFWLILMSALSVFSVIHHIFMMVTPSVNKMVLRSRR